MAGDKVFDDILDGPANIHQVRFLEKYIEDNIDELKRFPEYLKELRDLIQIISHDIEANNIIQFPVQ